MRPHCQLRLYATVFNTVPSRAPCAWASPTVLIADHKVQAPRERLECAQRQCAPAAVELRGTEVLAWDKKVARVVCARFETHHSSCVFGLLRANLDRT